MVLSLVFLAIACSVLAQDRGFVAVRREAKDHIALIIGNSAYPDNPLANPVNDAADVAKTFIEMGFVVEKVLDADKEQMAQAIDRFSQKLTSAKAAVFYYAGHGVQVGGDNYLIPIGFTPATQITTEDQVLYRAINAGEVLTAMEQAKVNFNLVVLDACRNNPFKGSGRGKVPGLASVNAPVGSLVMYATKAGSVAADGQNTRNSPFTTAFLKHVQTPGLDVNLLPSKITQTVGEITKGAQVPGTYMQLNSSFTFVPEISAEELKSLKQSQLSGLQARNAELEKQEAEMASKKALDDVLMAKKQADIDALDKQIAALKAKTISGTGQNSEGDLDQMLAIVKQKEAQKNELDEMQRKAEESRIAREKELAQMKLKAWSDKNAQIDADLDKYNQIANSEFGKDMAQAAWDNILVKYSLVKGSITLGNEKRLKDAVNMHPDMISLISGFAENMVLVPGGTFQMGSSEGDDNKPVHIVTVSDFYIGKYEVTQAQWRAIMNSSTSIGEPSYFNSCDDCPVEQVSWNDVQFFLQKLNQITGKKFRLPTEAEWECAARGGPNSNLSGVDGYIYAGSNTISDVAWHDGNSIGKTHPVGQKKPNELGIYDMTGNVWEWCADWYESDYYKNCPANNPQGPSSGTYRVNRGCSLDYHASSCSVAVRARNAPDGRSRIIGFRLVLVP